MTEIYPFHDEEIKKITDRFGEEFYQKVLRDLEVYSEQWQLSSFQLVSSYSANLVFTCDSENYGAAVLKIGSSSSNMSSEFNALLEYNGTSFCRVFEADLANSVILEERICPGIHLRAEDSLEKRLSVFCSLYQGLHKPSEEESRYSTYLGWVQKITDYMSTRDDCIELYKHMKKANELCITLTERYNRKMLLHGDFHHDNILLGRDGEYRIIDPKGVIGDPIWDCPRFMLNEFGDEITVDLYDKMNKIIEVLEKELDIPNDTLRQTFYVEMAMGICWCVEDGATAEEFPKLIEHVEFAESILNG